MKNNPLFFDSTKFRGDNVVVEIQLSGVELAHGEELISKITLLDGSENLVLMTAHGLRKWIAEARVEYRQRIKIEYLIKHNDEIIEKSEPRHIIATYSIYQKWDRQPKVLASSDLTDEFDESLINGPTLIENRHGVFEPLKPKTDGAIRNHNLPMIVEIKNPKTTVQEKSFNNENFISPNIKDLE